MFVRRYTTSKIIKAQLSEPVVKVIQQILTIFVITFVQLRKLNITDVFLFLDIALCSSNTFYITLFNSLPHYLMEKDVFLNRNTLKSIGKDYPF